MKNKRGFTIVELLIVIVVIGILATITIVAYNGLQRRAQDARRASDVATITKALEVYRADNGAYPEATSAAGAGNFERSNSSGDFMEYLKPIIGTVPVDPVNDSGDDTYSYQYFVYNEGSVAYEGCDASRGRLMVFYAYGFESGNVPQGSKSLVCANRTWTGNGTTYFKYSFDND